MNKIIVIILVSILFSCSNNRDGINTHKIVVEDKKSGHDIEITRGFSPGSEHYNKCEKCKKNKEEHER